NPTGELPWTLRVRLPVNSCYRFLQAAGEPGQQSLPAAQWFHVRGPARAAEIDLTLDVAPGHRGGRWVLSARERCVECVPAPPPRGGGRWCGPAPARAGTPGSRPAAW